MIFRSNGGDRSLLAGDFLPMAADHISNRLPAGSYNIGRTFLTLH
jgi:hypothetical protein